MLMESISSGIVTENHNWNTVYDGSLTTFILFHDMQLIKAK